MTDILYEVSLFILLMCSSAMVISCLGFSKSDTSLSNLMLSTSIFIPLLIIGTIQNQPLTLLIILGLFAFYTTLLLFTKNYSVNILWFALVIGVILPFIPFTFKIAEENLLSFSRIIAVITLFLNVILLQISRKDTTNHLSSIYGLLIFFIILGIFLPVEFAIGTFTIVFIFITWFTVHRLSENQSKHLNKIERKLDALESDFNEEVRKAVNRHTFHLKEVQEKMSHINKIDNLTKAYNKKAIFNIIEELTSDRKKEIFSIIMFDLDNFKTLNDSLGHVQGDFCLKTLSKIAKDSIRDTDYLGRYGGDEFIIVLPSANLSTTISIAERFRSKINKQTSPHFTISAGLATFPEDGNSITELLDIADKGLYLSKEKGKNSVSYHNPKTGKKY